MSKKVVVVGAGINGLVAAFYLRRAGLEVTLIERTDRVGGACVSEIATVNGRSQSYALGASVLGLMQDFVWQETGLARRLQTYVPNQPKRVYFPNGRHAWIYRDAQQLQQELADQWDEQGDVAAFRADEARVVTFLQEGYKMAVPPTLATAQEQLGKTLTQLWITGTAYDLLNHYFTAGQSKIYMGMTITESGPVSLHEPYSAFTLPLMDSGSVFDGYYGFVRPGIWRVTEELGQILREQGVDIRLDSRVLAVEPAQGKLRYEQDGHEQTADFDHLILATDPVTAVHLLNDSQLTATVANKRDLGSSGKLTLFFREPVRWRETHDDPAADTAFRFIFATNTLADFEAATLRVTAGEVAYEPGYIQIYCEGAAMRQLGLHEPFDRLTLFFKNLALGERGADLEAVATAVKDQLFPHIANPQDCVWSRLLTPKDLQQLFLFPGGNIDHTMLVNGQTFFERQFSADPERHFYQFGRYVNISYCGSATYPCGSIAGTPGYMCAQQIVRQS